MKPVFHAFSTLVLGAAASVGAQGLDVSLDGDTGRLLSVAVDGEIVLAADLNVAEAVKFDCDGNAGSWRYGFDWRVHEEERMLQGTLSFEWLGDEPVRLKGLTVFEGKVPFGAAAASSPSRGAFLLPGVWPPIRRAASGARSGRVNEGSAYTPMAIADNGRHSVMSCVDELSPCADYSTSSVTECIDGFLLSRSFETAGWMRKGEPQTVGDIWLVFRDGTAEDMLRHTGDWFRKIGMLPPADRPEWVRGIVACYSLHPCGRNDDMRCDPDGLALARSYLPYLEALGVNCIWMRPIEDKAPYMPRDYFALQPGVGTDAELASYVAEAHSRGIRVWRDAVPHGGHVDFPRAKEHPEFLAWKEDGKPDSWWTYDYFAPGWLSMFSGIVRDLTAAASLDGWRIDVATGSRFPNWNPGVPYARGSFARCQGALAMNRAIRAAARSVSPDAATLGETTHFSGAAVCDSIYDFKPTLLHYWRFTDTPVAECVRAIRRHLRERQAALPPGAIQMRYMENHDSHPALPLFGRAGATALFAMTAFCDGYPLVYQEAEDGCFEAMREILRVRRETPEILRGGADYECVAAPDGVFAVLRLFGDGAVVALVNFNGRRASGRVRAADGRFAPFDCDLPPFGWEVRRVAGKGKGKGDEKCPQLFTIGKCAQIANGTNDNCGQILTVTTNANEIIVRLPGATRWFARTAEGDFDGTSFVRHPRLGFVKSTVKHGEHDTAVRWTSALHPFGFTPDRACVGGVFPDGSAVTLSGFDTRLAEVSVLDRAGGEPGLAVSIRSSDPAGLRYEVDNCDLRFVNNCGQLPIVNNPESSLTGLPELTAVMGGWEWESGNMRLAIRRNGTLRAGWRRDAATGKWRQFVGTVDIRTDTGVGKTDPFGNPVKSVCSQNDAFGDPIRFWRGGDGAVHLDFGPGDLRPFHGRMAVPIWYRTRYTLQPGADSFDLEAAISIERDYAKGEGEIALRVVGDEGRSHRWLAPETSLSAPKGAWLPVTLHFGNENDKQPPTKEETP